MAVIIPTKKCDLRCAHCLRTDYEGGHLDPDLLGRFLSEFKKYSKQRSGHSLTGGEPTVHKDLQGLFSAFRDTDHSLSIVTNGQNDRGVETVIRNKDVVNRLSISLDAADREINDRTRGDGTFDKVVKHAKEYIQNGVDVGLRLVLHDGNAQTLEQVFELAQSLKIRRLHFSTLHPVAKGEADGMSVNNEKLRGAYKRLLELRQLYPSIQARMVIRHIAPYLQPEWVKAFCTPIGGALDAITLLPDGKICFCCDLVDNDFVQERYQGSNSPIDPIIGDYNKETLATIMERKKKRILSLRNRRGQDFADGNLEGARVFICENCKFYHYKTESESPAENVSNDINSLQFSES